VTLDSCSRREIRERNDLASSFPLQIHKYYEIKKYHLAFCCVGCEILVTHIEGET
jgi:hypothetical protein